MGIQEILKSLSKEDKKELASAIMSELNDIDAKEALLENSQNNFTCPHCGHDKIYKNGSVRGSQRFKCHKCNKSFGMTTNTIFQKTQKDLSVWKQYIDLMFENRSIRYISEKLKISVPTSFYWRHKILDALKNATSKDKKLDGIVEADETFFPLSFKGQKKLDRKPRKRGKQTKKRGISKDQACVVVATDRKQQSVSKAVCLGRVSTQNLDDNFTGAIEPYSVLVTDKQPAYYKFASKNDLKLKQMQSSMDVEGAFHIQNVNSFHSGLKGFMRGFKGVATKYLDNYLAFFEFAKKIDRKVFEAVIGERTVTTYSALRALKMELV